MAVVGSRLPLPNLLVCEYEKERADRVRANQKKIKEFGIAAAAEELAAAGPQPKERKPRSAKPQASDGGSDLAGPSRRSHRVDPEKKISYKDDEYWRDTFKGLPGLHGGGGGGGGGREARIVDEAEVAALRERNGADGVVTDTAGLTASAIKRGPVDSGKGVRIQGGKVYDSKYGVTCHWCRQKTLEDHVTCTSDACGKGKRLATTFCKNCLKNRHGEDAAEAYASGCWQCPKCRGSCGRGCVTCCNCGPCRKKLGLDPTHQILHSAKDAGFTNVHDYLVHLVTGEDADAIAARKPAQPWGAWLTGHVVERAAAAEGEEGEEEPAGAAAVREGSVSGSCCTASAAVAQSKKRRGGRKSAAAGEESAAIADASVQVDEPAAAGEPPAAKRARGRPPLPSSKAAARKAAARVDTAFAQPGKAAAGAPELDEAAVVAPEPVGAVVVAPEPVGAYVEEEGPAEAHEAEEDEEKEAAAAAASKEDEERNRNLSRKQRALLKLGLGARPSSQA